MGDIIKKAPISRALDAFERHIRKNAEYTHPGRYDDKSKQSIRHIVGLRTDLDEILVFIKDIAGEDVVTTLECRNRARELLWERNNESHEVKMSFLESELQRKIVNSFLDSVRDALDREYHPGLNQMFLGACGAVRGFNSVCPGILPQDLLNYIEEIEPMLKDRRFERDPVPFPDLDGV